MTGPPPLYHELEQRSFSSWPALEQTAHRGWVIRLADGYTKRANSVTALAFSAGGLDESIAYCEGLYGERGLIPTFRLTPCSQPEELDSRLEFRGYRVLDPSLVLHLDLATWRHCKENTSVQDSTLDAWMATFGRLSKSGPDRQAKHAGLLQRISTPRLLALLHNQEGRAIGCGLGVLDQDYLGLFDLVIDPELRQQGHGGTLVSAILQWAQEQGALHAYLQVVQANGPARHFYGSLGFQELYPYWYRIASVRS